MVQEANVKAASSERGLMEAEMKIDGLETEVAALKTLVKYLKKTLSLMKDEIQILLIIGKKVYNGRTYKITDTVTI